jgi:uncharacterized peroxidase-related enzyme
MPRINPVDPDHAAKEIVEVFEELKKTKWRIPMMYRVLAHSPGILRAHEGYFDAVMNQGALDRKLKEKVAFKIAHLNGCEYSTASHYRYALKCGVTEAEMKAVENMEVVNMTPREAAALELAVKMNASGKQVTAELFETLHANFSPSEIIELLATVGLMVFASRLADALALEAET